MNTRVQQKSPINITSISRAFNAPVYPRETILLLLNADATGKEEESRYFFFFFEEEKQALFLKPVVMISALHNGTSTRTNTISSFIGHSRQATNKYF
jgi:hypothetical protein